MHDSSSKVLHSYQIDNYLQGRIHSARQYALQEGVVVQLLIRIGNDWKSIAILPGIKRIVTSINDVQLKQMCPMPTRYMELKVRCHTVKGTPILEKDICAQKAGQHIDSFMWKVALWTSQGRILYGTNLKTPVYIRNWPNFTRLFHIPHAMRISALLVDRPCTLPMVAKVLKISQHNVFTYYAAAHAIDLVAPALHTADKLAETEPSLEHHYHELFNNVIKKLKGAA